MANSFRWRALVLATSLWLSLGGCSLDLSTAAQPPAESVPELALTPTQLTWVGRQIFQNECAGKVSCLVHWNRGEAFPSLGIGHFIWYPRGVDEPFVESFPTLIGFMQQRGAAVPDWLAALSPLDAPWTDRDSFLSQQDSPRVRSLRDFLERTQGLQAEFMFNRAHDSLARVQNGAPAGERVAVAQRLRALSATPGGVYALIDYVNFKGEGLAPSETYHGQGWGLLQVVQEMGQVVQEMGQVVQETGRVSAGTPLQQFRQAAGVVLTRRAENASKPIEQRQWLPGWLKRLDTYREP